MAQGLNEPQKNGKIDWTSFNHMRQRSGSRLSVEFRVLPYKYTWETSRCVFVVDICWRSTSMLAAASITRLPQSSRTAGNYTTDIRRAENRWRSKPMRSFKKAGMLIYQLLIKIHPPWTGEIRTNEPPTSIRSRTLEMLNNSSSLHVCTDNARSTDRKIGCSFCVPKCDVIINQFLTDHCSVYTTELTAIKLALQWCYTIANSRQNSATMVLFNS